PPAGGYPPAGSPGYGTGQKFNVGEAFSWSWTKFTNNAAALIVPALVYLVAIGALVGITYGLAFGLASDTGTTYQSYNGVQYSSTTTSFGAASIVVFIVGYVAVFVLAAAIQSAYISGLLEIADGHQVTIGTFFKFRNVGRVIVAGLIVGLLTAVGLALCVIPGIIVGFLLMFTIVALLDRDLSPVDAAKNSYEVTRNNLGDAVLAYVISLAIALVGEAVCFVGLIVAMPVVGLFQVYTYRRLSGRDVAPVNP
ncbi:MAG: hypothetical protein JO280_13500, partial [Mycobacteriaceae bacterium]|nr:hypothetical protein [Mycobacteriaceae bacterium]